jgi:PEP-CTERM motif
MNYRHALSSLAVSALLLSAAPVQAYGFDCLTNNSATNCATASQYQFFMYDAGTSVTFKFENNGPTASSITDIYFDDSSLFSSLTVGSYSGDGVSFSQGANPLNLPGGQTASPTFTATSGLAADSDTPTMIKGVNPNEWVQVNLLLASNKTFSDALADLTSGALRVGIHVQGFQPSGSESFINTPVPEPETYAMALVALGVLGMYRRRQTRSDKSTV